MIKRNRTEEGTRCCSHSTWRANLTPEFVEQWVLQYPQYAKDFRQHAGILAARLVQSQSPQLLPDETMLARGRSRALNAVYNADLDNTTQRSCTRHRQLHAAHRSCRHDDSRIGTRYQN